MTSMSIINYEYISELFAIQGNYEVLKFSEILKELRIQLSMDLMMYPERSLHIAAYLKELIVIENIGFIGRECTYNMYSKFIQESLDIIAMARIPRGDITNKLIAFMLEDKILRAIEDTDSLDFVVLYSDLFKEFFKRK